MILKTVKSLKELSDYIKSNAGQQAVFGSKQIQKSLNDAAKLLKDIMQEELQNYYDSYTPTVYERTYGLLNSLRISPLNRIGNQMQIKVYFDIDAATHESIFGGEPGYAAMLLNEGWSWHDKPGPYRLAHYEGFRFVEKSIERFVAMNKWGFRVAKDLPDKYK
ncbi:hypothetical protein D3C73_185620 [compost metagenome]